MPSRNRARTTIIIVKVLWALGTVGLRKRGTALLTASMPVNAVQPLAKAARHYPGAQGSSYPGEF